tara:strand:+ start:54 stop:257 length:204 start_codon:yes stop_codon:yes gene_type:complete
MKSHSDWLDVYEEKIYFLARHCWPVKDQYAPSGKRTWEEVFKNHSGMSLEEYKAYANEKNLRNKYRA